MSDEQVVERLAKREGWRLAFAENDNTGKYVYWITDPDDFLDTVKYDSPQTLGTVRETQAYLESHDALQPIFGGLSGDEWCHLFWQLTHHKSMPDESDAIAFTRYLLTMPPRDLAHAIASILEDKQPCPCTIGEPCSYACPCANPLMSGVCAKCRQLRELVADAIEKAVAEKQAEIDRLKAELERLAGERDTWRKRFEAQPSTYQLAAVEQERDKANNEWISAVGRSNAALLKAATTEHILRAQLGEACTVLNEMLASATPNQIEHSAMFYAWADARAFLQKILDNPQQ